MIVMLAAVIVLVLSPALAQIKPGSVSYPETIAVIEGHTDNVGSKESNHRLSAKRAESVRTYLIENFGIAANRLTARGYGSSRPVADNTTPEGRQKNRRIEAVIETTVMR